MNLKDLQKHWDRYGKTDPLWSIMTWRNKKGNKWEIDEFFETGKKEIEELVVYIESLDINVYRKKALDFGCGIGRLTQPLTKYFDEVYGIDISPSMIELANKHNSCPNKCIYYLNEVDNLKIFPDNTFDLIYSNIVLQHMEPQYSKNYIREFIRVLAPNGLLIFLLPSNPDQITETLKQLIRLNLPTFLLESLRVMGMYGINREEVINLLENNGLKIVDIVPDQKTNPGWLSFRYCATKE